MADRPFDAPNLLRHAAGRLHGFPDISEDLLDAADEIERLRTENERYYLLFTKLQDIAGDQRFSDEFVGSSTRRRLKKFAATKEENR